MKSVGTLDEAAYEEITMLLGVKDNAEVERDLAELVRHRLTQKNRSVEVDIDKV
jgi:hypothetical protein